MKLRLSNLTPTNDTLVQLDRIEQFVKDLSDITDKIKIAQLKSEAAAAAAANNAALNANVIPATPGSTANLLVSKRTAAPKANNKGSSATLLSSQVQTPQTRDVSTSSTNATSKLTTSFHAQ